MASASTSARRWWATSLLLLMVSVYVGLKAGGERGEVTLDGSFRGLKMYEVERPPWSDVPKERDMEDLLQRAEVMFQGQVQGPESIAFDPLGRGPYTGIADGRVVFWDGREWVDFAYTSPNRSELCGTKPSSLSYLKTEHVCGRPLGLRFDKRTGDLYIADAYFGILKVGPEGGLAMQITTEAEGVPFKFTNDLDVDDHGNIYFTDSSSNFQRRNFLQLVISAEPSGRLLKYDSTTMETTVLLRDLQFPNGVSLSMDRSFLVFCEGSKGRLTKYWLKAEKEGESELLAVLAGYPDNVRTTKDGHFWVALHRRHTLFTHVFSMYPKLRKFLLKLPIPAKIFHKIQAGGTPHAMIAKYDEHGKLLKVLEDRQGKVVRAVSEVEEKDGKLWLGSVVNPFIAVY